ncbi:MULTISPECIES: hypothetical protein [Frankia]|uniref:Uncharacterized protein n=1 Tax=Frankia alni (strain DSM 45986 / CECT 9034 / ACN14a) TaxID=326424 RepID=Q0RJL5_FRAAA|nr:MULTISPECIES: hypothetical protein [Frankia]CAJ62297.1 hypothetical protein FRAAL3654 [Frankia alni ACN14a]
MRIDTSVEAADATSLVIGMPQYNRGPLSQLRAWFDHIIASPLARAPQTMAPGLSLDHEESLANIWTDRLLERTS